MTAITERLSATLKDRYRIERELGEGGMATVYLAEDLKHDRKVALKVLRPELAAVIGGERFVQEIKTTANLQHPHILPLFDSGEAEGFLYYVMPFIDGETLRDKLNRETQLGVDEAVRITSDVADALDYAHRQGVIHRDIKPENILLHDGRPMVADFGIALAVSAAAGGRMTETGLSLGTPHYMSPEQATAEKTITSRADVYSLGAVLYEMLTGDPPHTGSTAQQIIMKIVTEEAAPVTSTRKSVPGNVAGAVAQALAKLPADRFESAAAFAQALANPTWAGGSVTTAAVLGAEPSPGGGLAQRTGVILGSVGAVIVAAVAFVAGRATSPEPELPLTRFVVPAPDSVSAFGRCCSPAMALSPDGKQLVFVGLRPGGAVLYRRELARLEAEIIPGAEGDIAGPFFSPDGRWVGYWGNGRLRKISMAGGPPVSIVEVPVIRGASWGDNDLIIFANDDDDLIYTVPASGGIPELVSDSTGGSSNLYRNPFILPGSEAALVHIDPTGAGLDESRIGVLDLASGALDTVVTGTSARYARGQLVFTGADGSLLAQPFDVGTRRTTGPAVALLDGVIVRRDGNGEFSVSESGSMVFHPGAVGGSETLQLNGPDGDSVIALPQGGNLEDPVFSPDGRRIALRIPDLGDAEDIWVFDVSQETLTRITVEGQNEVPVWSPDGRMIAFSSERETTEDHIYAKPSDGSGSAELLFAPERAEAWAHQWLPDGRLLISVGDFSDSRFDIGLLTPGDTAVEWLVRSPFFDRQPQISPDGRRLAYTSNRSGDWEVYVQAISGEGRRVQVSTQGGFAPHWSRDGSTLYYGTTGENEIIAASVQSRDGDFVVTGRTSRLRGQIDFNFIPVNYDLHPITEAVLVILQGSQSSFGKLVWIQGWDQIIREMQTGSTR